MSKTQCIFTKCEKCYKTKLKSTQCICLTYDTEKSLENHIYDVVKEYGSISAVNATHIINKLSKPRIIATYGIVNYTLRNDKKFKIIKSQNQYDNFILSEMEQLI